MLVDVITGRIKGPLMIDCVDRVPCVMETTGIV
jgi:hypothetical protein